MDQFIPSLLASARAFAKDEDGAQVIEYALIIAVVSIALIVLLKGIGDSNFSGFITKVQDCLKGAATCT